jgi:5-methylcytosine-specific restriction enzyme A
MKNCVKCGTQFKAKSVAHSFCSDRCRRGARGSNWRTIRNLILIRDKHTCQDCKETDKKLEVHHLLALALGGDNRIQNLLALCVSCHRKRHKSWRRSIADADTGRDTKRVAPRAEAA